MRPPRTSAKPNALPPHEQQMLGRRLRQWRYSSYDAYRRSAFWARKRKRILRRGRGRCEVCGRKATVVHHLTYELLCREPEDHLVALCDGCHHGAHELASQGKDLFVADLIYGAQQGFFPYGPASLDARIRMRMERSRRNRDEGKHRKAMRKPARDPQVSAETRKSRRLNDELHRRQVDVRVRREARVTQKG
jgi:hypothetical protein